MILQGQTAIVTGAANPAGIGCATAMLLAREGANTVFADIDRAGAQEAARRARSEGLEAQGIACDVTRQEDVRALAEAVRQAYGGTDILINNAGGSARLIHRQTSFADSLPETWAWVLRLNLLGPMGLIREVLPDMIARRRGRIVNVASIAGIRALGGYADYSAAKGGLIAFSRTLAQEVGGYGINVNCVAPGSIATRGNGPDTFLGRLGRAEEVAQMILYLCSEASGFVTGQCFAIDGGRSITSICRP
ncbi:MAG: SDR family NAD(P)-dependent oxidoreductase [Aristaeellaceae bacterium]